VTFALYLRTLLPSVGVADTFEFQVVVPLLRVAHPTGYPLYVLLGKLFTLLPLGNVAWRVNLASAVFATAAVLVLYAIILRLTGRWLPALLAALALAFSFTFWSQAIVAEVYALHNLLVAIILWLLLGRPEARRWQATFFLPTRLFRLHQRRPIPRGAAARRLARSRPLGHSWAATARAFRLDRAGAGASGDYYVPDISVFLLPAHLILALWIGAGIAYLIDLFSTIAQVRCLSLFIASLFIVHCFSRIWLNLPLVDQSHNRGGYAWGQYVLEIRPAVLLATD